MDLYEALARRRTIRGFTKPASEETLRKIIMAGAMAASPDNRQPWEFILVDDPELIKRISEHKYRQNQKIHPEPVALSQRNAYKNCCVVAMCYKKARPTIGVPGCVSRTFTWPLPRKGWA
jgi:nitroreductase